MTIKKAYVDTPDGQIHYRFIAGSGTPLIFFHRTPASSVTFEKMMGGLAGDRALYAFDTPGFGASFDPPGTPTIVSYANWLMAAVDSLDLGVFHIYGHHTGTHIATEIAASQPERVRTLMLNGVAYLTAEEREQFRQKIGTAAQPDPDGKYLQVVFELMKSLFPEWDAELVHREFTGAMRSTFTRDAAFNAIWNQDFPTVLAKVHCPILVLSCEDDLFAPYLDRIKSAHPDTTIVMQGPGRVAAPELDTENSVRIVREFIAEAEAG